MGLGQFPLGAIPLGPAPRSRFHRQSGRLQASIQSPPRRVDRSGVFERLGCLDLDLKMSKFCGSLIALRLITRMTSERQIANPVAGPSTTARDDMIHLKRLIGDTTIRTMAVPFF